MIPTSRRLCLRSDNCVRLDLLNKYMHAPRPPNELDLESANHSFLHTPSGFLEPARVPGNCARCMSSLVRSVFLGFLLILLTVRALRSRPPPATQPRMPHLLCHPSVYLTPYPPNFDPLTSILILTRSHLFDVIILTFPTILVRVTLYLFFSTMLLKALKSVCYLSSIRTTIDVIHPLFHSCLHQRKVQ